MSELLAPFGAPPEVVEEPDATAPATVAPAGVTHEPVVITEQQVLFATAAAVPLQPTKTRGWFSRLVGSIVASGSVASDDEGRVKPRHYPPRHDFLEDARMAREMHRL
ncbi:hypothetical protein [Mycobacterium sp. MMS18-G62]